MGGGEEEGRFEKGEGRIWKIHYNKKERKTVYIKIEGGEDLSQRGF